MSTELEQTARRIADRGEGVLVERLQEAFEEAAAAHSEALRLGNGQVEAMVQRAVERADGLQWRRALAAVATEELGIGLGEALGHPAVVRAHAILGAPSYEAGLAKLGPLTEALGSAHPKRPPALATEDAVEDEDDYGSDRAEPEPAVHLTGTHLGGIADLASPEPDVELWFSDEGLDIIRPTKEPLGRLTWAELHALEIPPARGRFGRRRRGHAYLVVRGRGGDASFEIPGSTPEELRELLAPVLGV